MGVKMCMFRRVKGGGCGKMARTRGLCHTHYGKIHDKVTAGYTTWVAEEEAGRCLKPVAIKDKQRTVYFGKR